MAIKQHRWTKRMRNLGAWDPRPPNRIREQTWARSGDRFRHREETREALRIHSATVSRDPSETPLGLSPLSFGNMCLLEIDIWISMSCASRMPGTSHHSRRAGRNNRWRRDCTWISDVKTGISGNFDDSVETGVFTRMEGEQCRHLGRC